MKKLIGALFIIVIVLATFIIANNSNKIPNGWYIAGSNPSEYEIGIDNTNNQNGNSCVYINSKSPTEKEFGTLVQSINADNFLEKRLRLSGYAKSENVKGWGAIWMRIDDDNYQQVGFDNMINRLIKGTTYWNKYEIVLDIPSNSKTINYGALLGGEGKIWFDNFKLEEVDKSVQVTNLLKGNKLPTQPLNLDFEE